MDDEKTLKIILLADRLDEPGPGDYTEDLARAVGDLGHEVFMVATAPSGDEAFWGVDVPVRLARRLNAWGLGGVMRQWLVRELRAFGPDLLHVSVPQLGKVARQIARRLDIPSVVTVHGLGVGEKEWSAADLHGSAVIAASQSIRGDLVNRYHIPKASVTVIYPGVEVRPGGIPGLSCDHHTSVVGTLGSLEYAEGHRFLLRAARQIVEAGLDLQVVIAGVGPEKENLRDLVAQLELHDVVTFVEDISRPRDLIEVMDIFVLPTMHEGLSPVVLEAMALGKPVVVSGSGGIFAAVQHNHTGLVFPKGDVEALTAAIVRLMLKPDFALRLAREGRELVRTEFSLDRMVAKTVQLYRRLTAEWAAAREPHAVGTSENEESG